MPEPTISSGLQAIAKAINRLADAVGGRGPELRDCHTCIHTGATRAGITPVCRDCEDLSNWEGSF